ncbi:hypothetical protein H114_00732 [Streptomyces gancidicus BKS 13-15]|uniref:Uncharacterized protein n=1 Tax=Streptomyces gancidicus BKS 13-15 TaxID=1284664 RepID=M3C407_STREZ|nr:hypothetical protein [Streptomyces gancidicus]EMF31109.1 hypothetical protein H114_00732 [Streptomyces gancidicus BKS 13-15]
MNVGLVPLAALAAPPLYAVAVEVARRCLGRCAVSFPGPHARPVRCTRRQRHSGRHLHRHTGSTWRNPAGGAW